MPASRPPRPQSPSRSPEKATKAERRSKKQSRKKVRQQHIRRPKKAPKNRQRGPRIACLSVPLFPLAARLRCEPELLREGLAIFEGNGHLARVVAATRPAREAGVRPGMTLTQARARMPKLVARARDPECERTAQEVLLEVADRFTPRVEDAEPGRAYLDVTGLDRHFRRRGKNGKNAGSTEGTAEDTAVDTAESTPAVCTETELGREILRQLDAAGLPGRVGIAASKLAAQVASGLAGSPTVVPAGEETAFLAPLPLYRLAPEAETAETLKRWGIDKIGELAQLPKAEVASRLGELGRRLHATARGLDPRPLIARQPSPIFREGMTLEWPILNLEPFLFIARTAVERLCQRLEARGLGCKRLELELRLEPDGFFERALELPSPTRETKTLLTLIRLDLEAHTPGAPVTGFTLQAHPDAPRLAQLSLLGPASLSPDRLATTLARLFALLGPGRVGSPRTVDGHRPERFRLVEYTPPPPPKVRPKVEAGHGLLAVRVLRPPVPLEVITDRDPIEAQAGPEPAPGPQPGRAVTSLGDVAEPVTGYGAQTDRQDSVAAPSDPSAPSIASRPCGLDRQPGLFRRGAERAPRPLELRSEMIAGVVEQEGRKPLQIQGSIRVASGPWELEERWWAEDRTRRDYWDVETDNGTLYRIYRERDSDRWFADGIYD